MPIAPDRRALLDRVCLTVIGKGKVCGHTYGWHFGGRSCIAGHRSGEASTCPCPGFSDGKGPRVFSRRRQVPADAVYVGRPTPWGNPFVIGQDGARGECIALYREWLMAPEQAALRARAKAELAGRDLACWCAPSPCHADVLLEVANGRLDPV